MKFSRWCKNSASARITQFDLHVTKFLPLEPILLNDFKEELVLVRKAPCMMGEPLEYHVSLL